MEEEIKQAAQRFLTAFDHLNWEAFSRLVAQDVTVIMPWPSFPNRLDGIAEVEAVFRPFFETASQERTGPPYLNLEPQGLQIQAFNEVGLVTFHLSEEDHFGRRTLIFEKRENHWLLVHLHASNFYHAV